MIGKIQGYAVEITPAKVVPVKQDAGDTELVSKQPHSIGLPVKFPNNVEVCISCELADVVYFINLSCEVECV